MSDPEPRSAAITAVTRTFALLGDPVAHSLSPLMQNAAFRAAAVDGVYVALRCDAPSAPTLLRGIASAGGGGNVTLPHKQTVLPALDVASGAVERTGACNTFWLENGRVHGDNTDVDAFRSVARELLGDPAGARILLLGAGGAARAAAVGLLEDGAQRIDVLNRTRSRAEALCDALGRRLHIADGTDLANESFDLVVNATSLGLHAHDPLPLDLERLRHAEAVFDLVYRPGGTPWSERAARAGVRAIDGTEMLLRQGAAAFERWWQRPAPLAAMRAMLTLATQNRDG